MKVYMYPDALLKTACQTVTTFDTRLHDILDESGNIKFYLPFDSFSKPPNFSGVEDYMNYKKNVMNFIIARNERIRELSIG